MTATTQRLGQMGENLATAHLRQLGWLILDRNWRCRHGELDIVGLDGSELVICEVRTRRGWRSGTALESVDSRKLTRLRELAQLWMVGRGVTPRRVRIDVIAIQVDGLAPPLIDHQRRVA